MADNSLVIGFDLGGTKMHAAAVDAHGHVIHSERSKTLAADGADAVIDRMIGLCRASSASSARAPPTCARSASASPAASTTRAAWSTPRPTSAGRRCRSSSASRRLHGLRVFLDNDVRVAVVGEHAYGVGKGTRTMVGIFVGTGIGGGIIVGHHTHHGGRGVAGEIGHMTLLPHGPRCGCGKRGCVEALASRTAMERDVRRLIEKGWHSKVPKLMKKAESETLTSSVIEQALDLDDDVMTQGAQGRAVLPRAARRQPGQRCSIPK